MKLTDAKVGDKIRVFTDNNEHLSSIRTDNASEAKVLFSSPECVMLHWETNPIEDTVHPKFAFRTAKGKNLIPDDLVAPDAGYAGFIYKSDSSKDPVNVECELATPSADRFTSKIKDAVPGDRITIALDYYQRPEKSLSQMKTAIEATVLSKDAKDGNIILAWREGEPTAAATINGTEVKQGAILGGFVARLPACPISEYPCIIHPKEEPKPVAPVENVVKKTALLSDAKLGDRVRLTSDVSVAYKEEATIVGISVDRTSILLGWKPDENTSCGYAPMLDVGHGLNRDNATFLPSAGVYFDRFWGTNGHYSCEILSSMPEPKIDDKEIEPVKTDDLVSDEKKETSVLSAGLLMAAGAFGGALISAMTKSPSVRVAEVSIEPLVEAAEEIVQNQQSA